MSTIGPIIREQLDNLMAGGPAGPPPSAGIAAATASQAIAEYAVAEAGLVAEEVAMATALVVQLVVSGEPNSPLHLQQTVEALTKQIALATEVLAEMESATATAIAAISGG